MNEFTPRSVTEGLSMMKLHNSIFMDSLELGVIKNETQLKLIGELSPELRFSILTELIRPGISSKQSQYFDSIAAYLKPETLSVEERAAYMSLFEWVNHISANFANPLTSGLLSDIGRNVEIFLGWGLSPKGIVEVFQDSPFKLFVGTKSETAA
jgi:hypothetical protein